MIGRPRFDDRIRVPPCVVTRAVSDATVLLNTDTGRYFSLDEVGTRVWALLGTLEAVQDVYDQLLTEYQVAPEELAQDLDALLQRLAGEGLVEACHGE